MTSTSFYQFEIQRLLHTLTEHCRGVIDFAKVRACVDDWAFARTKQIIDVNFEDETMNATIGMKVNKIGGNPGTGEGHCEYGIVVNNLAVEGVDIESPEEISPEVAAENKVRWQHLATLTMVSWFLADGSLSFTSWEDLKNLTVAESLNVAD
jgi:hypothetical protein